MQLLIIDTEERIKREKKLKRKCRLQAITVIILTIVNIILIYKAI